MAVNYLSTTSTSSSNVSSNVSSDIELSRTRVQIENMLQNNLIKDVSSMIKTQYVCSELCLMGEFAKELCIVFAFLAGVLYLYFKEEYIQLIATNINGLSMVLIILVRYFTAMSKDRTTKLQQIAKNFNISPNFVVDITDNLDEPKTTSTDQKTNQIQ